MNKKLILTPLAVAMAALSVSAMADELAPIVVKETIAINPNVSEPELYNATRGTPADGGDFLGQVNGISMSRFGGRGLEPIIRGQSQTRLNILLDGAYIHGGCPNRMDPPASWAALETYEKVDVLKGVQTVIYGGGGSGGTVLFERDTRGLAQEQPGLSGRVSAMGSDNGIESDLMADVLGAGEQGYIRLLGEIKKAENYEDGDGREVRSAFDHKQGGIILGYTPTQDRLLELSYEKNDFEDALYPGAGMDSPEESGDIVRFRYEDKPAAAWLDKIRTELYVSDVDHVMNNFSLRTPPNYGPTMAKAGQPMKRETTTNSTTSGGRVILTSMAGDMQWTYGVDLQKNARDATSFNMDTGVPKELAKMWPDVTIRQSGLFGEALKPLGNSQRIKAGLRVDYVDATIDSAAEKPPAAPKTPDQAYQFYYGIVARDKSETNVGGLLRYERDLNSGMSFFAGLSRSVRTADATERAFNKWAPMATSRWIGNPGLDPEQHHQLDMGLSRSTSDYSWNGVIFFDSVTDYILRDSAHGQDGILQSDKADIYRNVDAEILGAELEGRLRINETLDLSGSLAWVEATNTTDGDRPIAQTPPLDGKVQLDYSQTGWGLGARVRFADRQDRIDDLSKQEVGETAGWAALDLYGNYRFSSMFTARLGIDNVGDKTYALHASRSNLLDPVAIKVNEPGRIVWARVTAEF
jgi:iron complex outermembrane receptor protein